MDSNTLGDVKGLARERPWLLPSNRRVRHLQGISLRNFSLSPPTSRPRGKTIDDESLPYALKTPAKILAQRESHKLEHSRSSDDLRSSPGKLDGGADGKQANGNGSPKARPAISKRRRSTYSWTNAPPQVRQQQLEDVTLERLADTWFSLHCAGMQEPVYVSEIVEKSMNPSFRFFDLNVYGPQVTRQDELTIKFWAKTQKMQDYVLLVDLQLCLRSLQFIGKSLESFYHPLPSNCILLHLSDGIYTSFTDLPLDEPVFSAPNPSTKSHGTQSTSTFDALMRLSNLDNCIQDALATRGKLTLQISGLLEEQKQSLDTINAASQAEERLASTNRCIASTMKMIKSVRAKRSELQAGLETRRTAISSGSKSQLESEEDLASAQVDFDKRKALLQESKAALTGQTRRVCEDLLQIYPIENIEHKPLSFTIRGLHLPNAASLCAAEADPATTAAALGHVAHIVYILSFYLLTPVPYPPSPHGSTSTILDPISSNMPSAAARTFPLYQKGAVTYRFEYGVFLLNSDIELLMSRQGSRMVDLRHTLANLKYLLMVLSTGKGELPVGKKGIGTKRLDGTTASEDSKADGGSAGLQKMSGTNGTVPEVRILGDEDI